MFLIFCSLLSSASSSVCIGSFFIIFDYFLEKNGDAFDKINDIADCSHSSALITHTDLKKQEKSQPTYILKKIIIKNK